MIVARAKAWIGQDVLGLFNDAAAVFLYRVAGAVFVLLTQLALARWIGADELGRYVLAFSWCVFLAALAGLGFPRAAPRFIGKALADDRPDLVRGYVRAHLRIVLIASAVVVALATLVIAITGKPSSESARDVLYLGILAVPLFVLINLCSSTAHAFSWFRLAFVPNAVLRPLLLLVTISVLWLSNRELSATSVMLFHIGIAALLLIAQAFLVRQKVDNRLAAVAPAYETSTWIRTAPQLLIVTLFVGYFQDLNIINIGMYVDAEELAIYNVSLRLSFLISFGILAIHAIAMPKTAQLHAREDRVALQALTTHVARLQLLWSLIAVAGVVLLGEYLLSIFGPGFAAGYVALVVLAFAQLIASFFGPVTQVLSMTGHQDECLYAFSIALAAMLCLNHVVVGRYGIDGAAVVVAVTFFLQSAWLCIVVIRKVGVSPFAWSAARRRER